jgi:hypothetical protein
MSASREGAAPLHQEGRKAIDVMNSRSTDPLDEETHDSVEDPSDNTETVTEKNQNRAVAEADTVPLLPLGRSNQRLLDLLGVSNI